MPKGPNGQKRPGAPRSHSVMRRRTVALSAQRQAGAGRPKDQAFDPIVTVKNVAAFNDVVIPE